MRGPNELRPISLGAPAGYVTSHDGAGAPIKAVNGATRGVLIGVQGRTYGPTDALLSEQHPERTALQCVQIRSYGTDSTDMYA